MSHSHLELLEREHARLEQEIDRALLEMRHDEVAIARLKKLRLAVEDQIEAWRCDLGQDEVA